jgi:hypothetical protein
LIGMKTMKMTASILMSSNVERAFMFGILHRKH